MKIIKLEKEIIQAPEFGGIHVANIFCRIGRKSQRLVRAAALKLAQELLEIVKRPWTVAMVTRCQEG